MHYIIESSQRGTKLFMCMSLGGSFLLMHARCHMLELECLLTITDLIEETDHFKCERFRFIGLFPVAHTSITAGSQQQQRLLIFSYSASLTQSLRDLSKKKDTCLTVGGSSATQLRKTLYIQLLWSLQRFYWIKGNGVGEV